MVKVLCPVVPSPIPDYKTQRHRIRKRSKVSSFHSESSYQELAHTYLQSQSAPPRIVRAQSKPVEAALSPMGAAGV
jgi:hypothetical protein